VPTVVLRRSTEWVEAVERSGGSMVVVDLDRPHAATELARLVPADPALAAAAARDRAATLALEPAGAAEAISVTLAEGEAA